VECTLPPAIDARLPRERLRNARVLRDWDHFVRETATPLDDEIRILLLSNSQGRGPELPAGQIYAALLEQRLNDGRVGPRVRVVNWSFAASRLPETVVLLARARELRPHLVLAVFPPNFFREEGGSELGRLEGDVTDTAWLYRRQLPAAFRDRYLHAADSVRAVLARAWPSYRFRDLPIFALAVRAPWLRPLFPESVQGPWQDIGLAVFPRRRPGRTPAFQIQQPDPALLGMFADGAAGLRPATLVFVHEPLWYRLPPEHEPLIDAITAGLSQRGWTVWDLRDAVPWYQFFDERVHFTADGHKAFAEALAARIAPLLPGAQATNP
jgi:hypothetical protein